MAAYPVSADVLVCSRKKILKRNSAMKHFKEARDAPTNLFLTAPCKGYPLNLPEWGDQVLSAKTTSVKSSSACGCLPPQDSKKVWHFNLLGTGTFGPIFQPTYKKMLGLFLAPLLKALNLKSLLSGPIAIF